MDFNQHLKKEIPLAEFDALCDSLFKCRNRLEEHKKEQKKLQEEYDAIERKVMGIMTECGKDKYYAQGLGTLYFSNRDTVTMPKDPADREAFFNYLKEKGAFEGLITVNSQTLNSFYKQEAEIANSPDFKIPGIGTPTRIKTLNMKRG